MGELIRNLYQQWGVICIELFRSNTPKSLCCKEFSQLVPLSEDIAEEITETDLSKLKRLGIDEIALVKGQKNYCAVLVNLDTRKLISSHAKLITQIKN
ncbi:Mobile element protein [Microcystis aeruginosa NIES-98]|nr:Mobile element protein [Microcystis aeruginosa NIES-98]